MKCYVQIMFLKYKSYKCVTERMLGIDTNKRKSPYGVRTIWKRHWKHKLQRAQRSSERVCRQGVSWNVLMHVAIS